MRAPAIAALLAVLGGFFLFVSAFLGVTALADWTILAAELCLAVATVTFLAWFLAGCVSDIRNAH
jgi:hypothetical protein